MVERNGKKDGRHLLQSMCLCLERRDVIYSLGSRAVYPLPQSMLRVKQSALHGNCLIYFDTTVFAYSVTYRRIGREERNL